MVINIWTNSVIPLSSSLQQIVNLKKKYSSLVGISNVLMGIGTYNCWHSTRLCVLIPNTFEYNSLLPAGYIEHRVKHQTYNSQYNPSNASEAATQWQQIKFKRNQVVSKPSGEQSSKPMTSRVFTCVTVGRKPTSTVLFVSIFRYMYTFSSRHVSGWWKTLISISARKGQLGLM